MADIESFEPQVKEQTWGQEILVASTEHYLGKVLKMIAGTAGGLQYHVEKDETFYLMFGEARVYYDHGDGKLSVRTMKPGQSFHVPPGAVHRVEAVRDCVFFEASTPHVDDRVRCEAKYGEPEVGGLPTTR